MPVLFAATGMNQIHAGWEKCLFYKPRAA